MDMRSTKVLITGGSRGLGRALGEALGRRGAEVLLVARGAEELDETVEALRRAGHRAHAIVADVAAPDAAARIAGAAMAMVGPIDLVVHNASTLGPTPLRLLADTSDEAFERALAVNVTAAFRLTRALVGSMVQRGRGAIVHVSSDAAVEAYPRWGAYGASKAALDHLARTWAVELDGTGIDVVAIDPGEMDTVMHAEAMPDADRASLARPEDVAERIATWLERGVTSGVRARVRAAEVAS